MHERSLKEELGKRLPWMPMSRCVTSACYLVLYKYESQAVYFPVLPFQQTHFARL